VTDHRPVLFNFFDVVGLGIIVASGATAVFLVDAKSLPVAVVAFTVGATVPIAGFTLLGRIPRRKPEQKDD